MTVMAFLLLVIFFLAFFIFFSSLNPDSMALFFWFDRQLDVSPAVLVVGCVLFGLVVGYLFHLYGATTYFVRDWRRKREDKRTRGVDDLYRQGMARLISGDYKKARRLLQRAHGQNAGRIDVLLALGRLCQAEGVAAEGLEFLLRARKQAPEQLEVLFELARCQLAAEQGDEALASYRSILVLEPDNPEALRRLRELHIKAERWNEALELQKRLVKKAGTAAENLILAGLRLETARLALEDSQLDAALGELKALVREQPDFVPARVLLGDVHRSRNAAADAAAIWQEGYRRFGEAVFLARLEDLAMATEDPAELLAFYRTVALDRPEDLLLRLYYGKFCLRLEMVDEALEQLAEIEKSGADFPQLHLLQAEAHVRRKRLEESVREFRRVVAFDGRLGFSFDCDACSAHTGPWVARCPQCGAWGSSNLAGRELIKTPPAGDVREIHHGERSA
jgi:lipopolysaccharide biosynthesis regulator YciM